MYIVRSTGRLYGSEASVSEAISLFALYVCVSHLKVSPVYSL